MVLQSPSQTHMDPRDGALNHREPCVELRGYLPRPLGFYPANKQQDLKECVRVYMSLYIHIYVQVCMYTYILCMCVSIYVYMHTSI